MVLLKTGVRHQASGNRKYRFKIFTFILTVACCLMPIAFAFAEEKAYKIAIEGMHCKSCIYSVTKSLKKLKQVRDVEVRLKEGVAIVVLKDGKDVTAEELEEAVKDSGYKPGKVDIAPSK